VQGYLSKTDLLAEAALLKERLGNAASPVVFCHNDALLANIVYQQEKEQVGHCFDYGIILFYYFHPNNQSRQRIIIILELSLIFLDSSICVYFVPLILT